MRSHRGARERNHAILFDRERREEQQDDDNTNCSPNCAGHFTSLQGKLPMPVRGATNMPGLVDRDKSLRMRAIGGDRDASEHAPRLTIPAVDHDFRMCAVARRAHTACAVVCIAGNPD